MSHFFEFVSGSLDGSVPINNYVIQKQIISMEKLNNFETFIRLNESSTQRESAISTAVSKLKARYGDTLEKFLKNVKEKENGVDDVKDYLVKVLTPYLERIEGQEKLQSSQFGLDFDGLLSGLASWSLVEMRLARMKTKIENK